MSAGAAAFEAFVRRLESLKELDAAVAKAAVEPVTKALQATANAGTTPDGEAWAELAEGGRALRGAAAAYEGSAKGTSVEVRIGKPYVFHNYGAGGSSQSKVAVRERSRSAKQRAAGTRPASKFHAPRRQLLPEAGDRIPPGVRKALERAAKAAFERRMGVT